MALNSGIEWTDATWNPVTGCSKISTGCKNCYALRTSHRLKAMGSYRYRNAFDVTTHEDVLKEPLRWKKPKKIFVNSMSDLFHEDIPLDFIKKVFDIMNQAEHHIFQILTKRPGIAVQYAKEFNWTDNIWMGTSVEKKGLIWRVDEVKKVPAHIKFLSCEPLLGPLPALPLEGIDWVIVGGESGPKARECREDWVTDVRDQCLESNTPFFFKQWGGTRKKKTGRVLEGRTWDEMPRGKFELFLGQVK